MEEKNREAVSEVITAPKVEKMFKEEIYDRMPFTYKQVDLFTKVLIGLTIGVIILGTIMGNM